MSLPEVVIPLFTHFIPILFFAYMGIDVLLRDPKKVEHRLLSVITLCFMLLFIEEYVRHQLPIEYSPVLASVWLSSVGILIPGLGFHLLIKFSRIEHKMPRYIYPYIFYVPLLFLFLNIFTNEQLISAHEFVQDGLWKVPVYNQPYYIAMACSVVNSLLYLIPLMIGKANARIQEHKAVLNIMIYGVVISAVWFGLFGLVNFGGRLPPYPYLYGGAVWCFFLRRAMNKYDFLNFIDKRYQKLFNMNPAAILLADLGGRIKEVNPAAEQLFRGRELSNAAYPELLNEDLCRRIDNQDKITHYESILNLDGREVHVLIEGDYVLLEYEPHVILMFRDITQQKEHQKEITFLAYHDSLTGLPNRRYFYERLEKAVGEARTRQDQLAVVLIDLDYFKEVNDRYGHEKGDEVLVQAGAIIAESIGDNGIAARLGGDEFVILMLQVTTARDVQAAMENMRMKFKQQVLLMQLQVPVDMSFGAAYYPNDADHGEALILHADKEMYRFKQRSKARRWEEELG